VGGGEVEHAVILGRRVGLAERPRGPGEQRLDLVGGDARALLDDQGGGAGDDRGSLRGAGPLEEAVGDAGGRVGKVDGRAGVAQADDRGAGRDQVGVAGAVATARPGRDGVVGVAGGAGGVGGADGQQCGS
jgi:hypothetical protein